MEFEINSDVTQASTIPSQFYTSNDIFDLTKEKIFATSWQFCLSDEELRLPGQVVPITLLPGYLDEPIIFVRDMNDQVRCLSNICTHRGNMLVEAPCVLQQHLKCRYHGRRFNLNGEFVHMPEFENTQHFPSPNDNLITVPFDKFDPFLFASIKPLIPFAEVMRPIKERLSWLPLDRARLDPNRSRDYLVKAHWALYCENYLEGLHIPFVHKSLRAALDYGNYTTELFPYCNLQLGLANGAEDIFDIPADSPDHGKFVAAYYFWIFPNTMLNFYPWGCSVNIVKPMGPELTKVTFLSYVLDESKLHRGAGAELDKVEREDESVVECVQKGIRSRFYNRGRYSPTREQGVHHFHQLLAQFLV